MKAAIDVEYHLFEKLELIYDDQTNILEKLNNYSLNQSNRNPDIDDLISLAKRVESFKEDHSGTALMENEVIKDMFTEVIFNMKLISRLMESCFDYS